jgi:uncharacterized protein YfdQ (DUF2303 family)
MDQKSDSVIGERMEGEDGVQSAIEAGYRIGELESADVINIEGIPHALAKTGMELLSMEALLEAPKTVPSAREFDSGASFCEYVREFICESTHLYGYLKESQIVAVIDDNHRKAGAEIERMWGRMTAILGLKKSGEWTDIESANKRQMSHVEFVEWLQDHLSFIVEPDASAIIESASAFSAHRGAQFQSVVPASGGDLEVAYSEEVRGTTRSGSLPMPKRIVLAARPFMHCQPVPLEALVRWRLSSDGKIVFSLTVLRMREAIEHEFARQVGMVAECLGKPVLV